MFSLRNLGLLKVSLNFVGNLIARVSRTLKFILRSFLTFVRGKLRTYKDSLKKGWSSQGKKEATLCHQK